LNLLGIILAYAMNAYAALSGFSAERVDCEWVSQVTANTTVDCYDQFVHYNAKVATNAYRARGQSNLKVASFNVLYQGSKRSRFKDLSLMTEIMNDFDIISVQEILNTDSKSEAHNDRLWNYYNETQDPEALKHFDLPPAVLILNEMRKHDPSWALILSRKAKVDGRNDIEEVGFFYRGSVVKPVMNEHCAYGNRSKVESVACAIRPTKTLIGRDVSQVFGRYPFIASFKSGNFDFAFLSSHIVFGSPSDEELKTTILQQAFGVSSYEDLGVGVTASTYARWAEMKVVADFMKAYKKNYHEQDVIFAGDTNLEGRFPLWETIAKDAGGFELEILDPTTISVNKYRRDVETNGLASNYDHFLVHPQDTKECNAKNSSVVYYHEGELARGINSRYLVRGQTGTLTSVGKKKWKRAADKYEAMMGSLLTVKNNQLSPMFSEEEIALDLQIYEGRIFETQLQDSTYYKLYQELISDHFPIVMSCSRTQSDDD